MDTHGAEISKLILARLSDGVAQADIETSLEQEGFDIFLVRKLMDECIKLHASRKRAIGLALILAGAAICLLSCIITLVYGSGQNSTFMLLGLTTLGILVAFAGLVKIF